MRPGRAAGVTAALSAIALPLLVCAACYVGAAADEAGEALDRRVACLQELADVRRLCDAGVAPDAEQLARVSTLFPGEQLVCVHVGGACYLAFAGTGGVDAAGPLAMGGR